MGIPANPDSRNRDKVPVGLSQRLGLRVQQLADEREMGMDQAASQLVELGLVLLFYPDKFQALDLKKAQCLMCGRSSTVERQLPKLDVAGSIPVARSKPTQPWSAVHPDEPHDCGGEVGYNNFFDAYFCSACDLWLTEPCGAKDHSHCGYDCWLRPAKPSEMT